MVSLFELYQEQDAMLVNLQERLVALERERASMFATNEYGTVTCMDVNS